MPDVSKHFDIVEKLNDQQESALFLAIQMRKFEVANTLIYDFGAKLEEVIPKLIESNNVNGMELVITEILRQAEGNQTKLYQILDHHWEDLKNKMSSSIDLFTKYIEMGKLFLANGMEQTYVTPPDNRYNRQ